MSIQASLKLISLLICICFLSTSCKKSEAKNEEELSKVAHQEVKNEVECIVLKAGDFNKEMLSNGKLISINSAELHFRNKANIEKILTRNGKRVHKGQLLAVQDNFDQKIILEQSQEALLKAKLNLEDLLIAQGFSSKDSMIIDADLLKIAKLKSGYYQAETNLKKASHDLESCNIRAPFRGVIANLISKENNMSKAEAFCTIIDDSSFEVEFEIMESEKSEISLKQEVEIYCLANKETHKALVWKINPLINENGLLKIWAKLKNSKLSLTQGMNVNIRIQKQIANQLIVPKSALLLRQNKEVVFVHENGLAIWKYVKSSDENSSSYLISEGLKEGDQVIISGNLNLAHEAKIEVVD